MIVLKFRRQKNFSTDTNHTKEGILSTAIVVIIILFALFSLFNLIIYLEHFNNADINTIRNHARILLIYSVFLFLGIPMFLLLNPAILYDLDVSVPENHPNVRRKLNIKDSEKAIVRNSESASTVDAYYKLSERILEYMKTERPYLNRDFTVHDLCTDLNAPRHHVQYCLKMILNKSFTDLKNEFRIEHAKELMTKKEDRFFSIDGVGQQSGFASSSNFFATFKQVTGMTPSQWMEKERPL